MPLPYPTNPTLQAVPVYQPGRPIEEVARELGLPADDIIKLASNENPLGPSRLALAAMRKALAQVNLYPDGNAFYLKQKLAAKLGVTPAHLILGNGSNEVIEFIGHALIAPGAEVVVSQYCFAVYPIVTALFGGKLVVVPAKNYGHDLDAMLAAITPEHAGGLRRQPQQPDRHQRPPRRPRPLRRRRARERPGRPGRGLHRIPGRAARPAAGDSQPGRRPNLLLMRTFSKIYGLAGLRLGYGIGHPDLIAELEKIRQPFNINAIAQAGALAALDDTAHAEKTRRINSRGLKFYARAFRKLGLEFIPSSANFILVRVGDGQRVFNELQKLGVIVRPMGGYQLPEWVRISVGTPKENQRCLEALKDGSSPNPNA